MQSSLYVALSGQVALQKRLDTIANNIANVNTSGFRAEEASRLKDEFLATVSHELTSPLNSISGWARILRTGNLGKLKNKALCCTTGGFSRSGDGQSWPQPASFLPSP